MVLLRGQDDRDLLPPELSGTHAETGERPLLCHRRRGAGGGLPGVQAVPARCHAGLAGVGSEGRPRRPGAPGEEAAVTLRLPYRAPFDGRALIRFLARRAVPGVEEVIDDIYRRSLRLPFGAGVVELAPDRDRICARFWLDDLRDLGTA